MEIAALTINIIHAPEELRGKDKNEILACIDNKINYHIITAKAWRKAKRDFKENKIRVVFDKEIKL